MATKSKSAELSELTTLAKDIVKDGEQLIAEHLALLRGEVHEQLDHIKSAAVRIGPGAGLVAASGLLSALTGVHLLHRMTRLPLWGCYGLMATTMGMAGMQLLAAGRREAERVRLLSLPQTVETLKEDAAWLKDTLQSRS